MSLRKRKLVEEAFGWVKTIAGCAKVKVRGTLRVPEFHFTLAMAASNLIRLPKRIEELKAKIKLAFPAAYPHQAIARGHHRHHHHVRPITRGRSCRASPRSPTPTRPAASPKRQPSNPADGARAERLSFTAPNTGG